jgi:membrane associated rhomboid family serine protease
MSLSITIIIIIITSVISFLAFSNKDLMSKLIFSPPDVYRRNQWYRFFSNGLIHADMGHLIFNMYAFYLFGAFVEGGFQYVFGSAGSLLYLIMYVSALAVCLIPSYNRNKDNYYYKSLGASGAVSAVIFAAILMNPVTGIGLVFIPKLSIPGFVFGPLYLIITAYLDKRGGGNINHSAHLWGALYGIVFLIAMSFALNTQYNPLSSFVNAVQDYITN